MSTYSTTKSAALYEEALKYMPGSQSNLGIPLIDRALFFERGEGARLWDVDGKEYIEFWNGAGPGFLGYGNREHIEAMKKQLDTLPYLPSLALIPAEIELARKVVEHVPCAEKVRFVTTGSEAVQLAIRLGRAHTKRPYFIRFEGNYHGWLDNVIGGQASDDPVNDPFPKEFEGDFMGTEGRAPHAFSDGFLLPWNDADVLERVLQKYGEEVALVHMEPIMCNSGCCPPRPGYLERVRELCTEYGVVLSFDEVITGFRMGLGGAQGKLGVTPDIATFGKAMAGGAAVAAVAGKKEILDLLLERRVIGAGTFNGNPVYIAAALANIQILERDNAAIYSRIDRRQEALVKGLREIAHRHGIPCITQGPRGVLFFSFCEKDALYTRAEIREFVDMERFPKFATAMIDEGIVFWRDGRWYFSGALTEADISETLERTDRAMSKV